MYAEQYLRDLPEDFFDPSTVDLAALVEELKQIRDDIRDDVGEDDIRHLKKIERVGKISTMLGYGTAWMAPNPLSAYLISQGLLTRWVLMHHISHRGYDKVPGIPEKYTSKVFGRGARRLFDWMDWILPEAWHEEHDFLHHFRLGEDGDPDVLERNAAWMRHENVPMWVRKALVGGLSVTWKWLYYAPSTMREYQDVRARRNKEDAPERMVMLNPLNERGRELFESALIPHFLWRFVAIPAAFAPLGPLAVANVLVNSFLAELITNFHAFLIIGPNHTGPDLYRFDEPIENRDEFYLRQIIGSTNYKTGGDVIDYLQMWLNYQIEHHLWPDMTMLQYRKVQPKVEEVCERHGVPYVQESVFTRARKMVSVIVGESKMRRLKNAIDSPFETFRAAAAE